MIRAEMNETILKGGQRFPQKRLKQLLRFVERLSGARDYSVSIAFVSKADIKKANRLYRKKNRVTDVLSFSLTPDHGELLICYDQAAKQAKTMKHTTGDEVTFLLVHGLLHLFGHDHEKTKDARAMFSIQEKILEALHVNPKLHYD